MRKLNFDQGMALISEAFPRLEFNPKVWWPICKDLDGPCFVLAVHDFIKFTKEVYPTSNPLAIIIEKHDDFVQARREREQKKLTVESEDEKLRRWRKESAPPPQNWKELMRKLKKVGCEKVQKRRNN